jgi:hypothetical protein
MTTTYSADDFVRMVRAEFPASTQPELAEEIADMDGLPHLQVAAVGQPTLNRGKH